MRPLDAFDAIVTGAGASPRFAARVMEMRRAFERRTGSFGPEDPWFEARSLAFWDDALTFQGFAREALSMAELADGDGLGSWVAPFEHAHRGLFEARAEPSDDGEGWVLRDLWSGAEFAVRHAEVGMKDALGAASSPIDGRVVARLRSGSLEVAILPGAIFHPADARAPILNVLDAARAKNKSTHDVLDALLRMERNLRSLSRVKPSYAYRESALEQETPPR